MPTVISIFGTTASGKTSFALRLAEQVLALKDSHHRNLFLGVDLISADSKQVYSDIKVISGADVPKDFIKVNSDYLFPYFKKELGAKDITIHGVDILARHEQWSLALFKDFAVQVINQSLDNNRLPIVVGGTTLYLNHLFSLDSKLAIPPNKQLRKQTETMSVSELQSWLKEVNEYKFTMMNNSDINNRRRLVRSLEISLDRTAVGSVKTLSTNINNLRLGLTIENKLLQTKIKKRVLERFSSGGLEEAQLLMSYCSDLKINHGICSALGMTDLFSYLNNEVTKQSCLENWSLHELQYAKKQLVWFRKMQDVIWLDEKQKSLYTLDSSIFNKNNEKISVH